MKTSRQKKQAFTKEMEKLKKEDKLKENKKVFEDVLKKAVSVKKQKPFGR